MPTPLCRRGPRAPQRRWNGGATDVTEKITVGCSIVVPKGSTVTRKRGCRVAEASGGSLMISSPEVQATHELVADLDRLGDQIAELSAHLDAATARLLDLIREFDARDGWNTGFRSCAAWLSWRVGLAPGAARERLRRGRLTPEVGAVVMKALEAARETLYQSSRDVSAETSLPEVTPTIAQQQADAIALVAETALHRGIDPGNAGDRYQVVVHVDAPVFADSDAPGQSILDDDTHVSAETSRRLACDASRVVMRHDAQGHVVEIGARTRTIPPALRRALDHRDRGCRFPGCGVRFGQGHHIRHWAHGGHTTLSNLALLCRRHHRAVHEEGYQVDRQPDGTLSFRRPDGAPLPAVPTPATVPADPVEVLRARHDAQGLQIHARTSMPGWMGERLDLGWAISVLHPLAVG